MPARRVRFCANLPAACCVEVPCLVDRNGVQPTQIGLLSPQGAAVNRTNDNVQELAVQAAVSGAPSHVHHAVALDPLTGAGLVHGEIRAMVEEVFAAEARWLPQFSRQH